MSPDPAEPTDPEVLSSASGATADAPAKPTLDDVARLTAGSDFKPFAAPGVDARVRNAALKKLFLTDPHFQHGDDLDVRVDEEMQLAQSPLARQQKVKQARALGLLDDELLDQVEPPAGGVQPGA